MELKSLCKHGGRGCSTVLIVPFMELKFGEGVILTLNVTSLNRTFYGIEIQFGLCMVATTLGLNRTFYGIEIYHC